MKIVARLVKTEKKTNESMPLRSIPSLTLFQVKDTEDIGMIIPCGHNVASDIVVWLDGTSDGIIGWDNFNTIRDKSEYDDCFILPSDKSIELTNEED